MPTSVLPQAILAAREGRQQALTRCLAAGYRASVCVALNIPGADKAPAGTEALFAETLGRLFAACADAALLGSAADALGPYAIVGVDAEPNAVKARCVALEAADARSRLVDLDVYSADAKQVGRADLGLPARSCLVCAEPAVDCIRGKRHAPGDIVAAAHALLAR